MILSSSVALSILDNVEFRYLLKLANPQYRLPTTKTMITSTLPKEYKTCVAKLVQELDDCESVATTADCWTDPCQRGFIAITSHYINDNWEVKNGLLDCIRYKEKSSDENIYNMFDEITTRFKINDKIKYVVTDNGKNMIKAFKPNIIMDQSLTLEQSISENSTTEDSTSQSQPKSVRSDDTLNDLSEIEPENLLESAHVVIEAFGDNYFSGERISCVAHTLQLCVKDLNGILKSVDNSVEKVAKYINSAHKSNKIRNRLDEFDKSFKQRNSTRWNSSYDMLKSFLSLSDEQLNFIFEKDSVVTCIERERLNELILILSGLAEMTTKIQKDAFSIGCVIPLYRGALFKLDRVKDDLRHCDRLRIKLKSSMETRLGFIFSNPIFRLAALLTPKYCRRWCSEDEALELDELFCDTFDEHLLSVISSKANAESDSPSPPKQPSKKARFESDLLSYMPDDAIDKSVTSFTCAKDYLKAYLDAVTTAAKDTISGKQSDIDTAKFWKKNQNLFPELARFTKFILTVPATSAPVERVFSVGGYILQPRRRRITDKLFRRLIFLKCNYHLLKNRKCKEIETDGLIELK